jgi:hypothetical protein
MYGGYPGEEQLAKPWIHMVSLEKLAESLHEGRVYGASVGVWAAQKMGFIFTEAAACRWAGR